ncbi:MAG: ribonucleotide-diphosphate reductase subunit beta, partial [Oxalobacteraceae bacterium]
TKDKIDFKHSNDTTKFIFTQTILRQVALDSLQGRAPSQIFTPVSSVPELEALVSNWSFFETNIHSNSYSHIIRNVYQMPKEQFDSMHDIGPIVEMAAGVGRYYDGLHNLNIRKELNIPVDEQEHINAIWMALNASLALECIRFLSSFAVSLAWMEQGIFMGNGNIISLILQDELLHTEWTTYLIKQVVKDDPRFARAKVECEAEVYRMYLEVIEEEKAWADYLFQHGVVIGLNAEILKNFVDYTATTRLGAIGVKYLENPVKTNPLPWFQKHVDISKKQVALQETESGNYVIGVMSSEVELDELPNL